MYHVIDWPIKSSFAIQIDGQLTLGENIADNGGVRSAFRAFKNVMNGTIDKPLIDGHTPEQLFFVAFAQVAILCHTVKAYWLLVFYSCGVQSLVMIL